MHQDGLHAQRTYKCNNAQTAVALYYIRIIRTHINIHNRERMKNISHCYYIYNIFKQL